MLHYNKRTHTLEYRGHPYTLQEPERPQLFREQFPFSEVPKLSWNHRLNAKDIPADIWIVDATFVEGQRGRRAYTSDQTVRLFELLVRLGGQQGVIRQTALPIETKEDRRSLERCLERDYRYPVITASCGGTKQDFALVKTLGLREAGFAVPASDYQIRLRHGRSRKHVFERACDQVRAALDEGIVPRVHLDDVTRADVFGFVIPLAKELLSIAERGKSKVKLRLCDTFGLGVPYNGTSLPRSVPALLNALTHYGSYPPEWLEWMGTNDFYKVVSNAATAWMFGSAGNAATLLGLGERTGYCPVEALIMEYAQLRGTLGGADPTVLAEIAAFAKEQLRLKLPSHMPLTGRRAVVVQAQAGERPRIADHPEAFHAFDTEKVLKRPFRILGDSDSPAGASAEPAAAEPNPADDAPAPPAAE